MNKNFKFYLIIWAIMLVLYNTVIFIVRPVLPGFEVVYNARFWIAWSITLVAFVGSSICAYHTLKQDNLEKVFYRIPLIRISYLCLLAMLVASAVLILIPNCPTWVSAVVCIVILALQATSAIKSEWAAQTIEATGQKVCTQTSFIRTITTQAQSLCACAKTPKAKAACKKVHEALRYSDPMSTGALADIEMEIEQVFSTFSSEVKEGVSDADCTVTAERLLALIADRNTQCKAGK